MRYNVVRELPELSTTFGTYSFLFPKHSQLTEFMSCPKLKVPPQLTRFTFLPMWKIALFHISSEHAGNLCAHIVITQHCPLCQLSTKTTGHRVWGWASDFHVLLIAQTAAPWRTQRAELMKEQGLFERFLLRKHQRFGCRHVIRPTKLSDLPC